MFGWGLQLTNLSVLFTLGAVNCDQRWRDTVLAKTAPTGSLGGGWSLEYTCCVCSSSSHCGCPCHYWSTNLRDHSCRLWDLPVRTISLESWLVAHLPHTGWTQKWVSSECFRALLLPRGWMQGHSQGGLHSTTDPTLAYPHSSGVRGIPSRHTWAHCPQCMCRIPLSEEERPLPSSHIHTEYH